MDDRAFTKLADFLLKIPALDGPIFKGTDKNDLWWVKFSININHQLAWHVVQELGFVLNNLSIQENLPTVFYPVSPPPYLNGSPKDYLSWVIETKSKKFKPGTCARWLESRLPQPVEDEAQWQVDE
ncbi:MAG: hypothetical protein H6667_08230 [Ardenticatenaceae bacterium]|nr:hypothetical protein [Ardenticatenaceae bacterium]MCB9444708.1 hypothetical protein [Ardenticatenaceae bacterium]